MKKRKIYRGWIDPSNPIELPRWVSEKSEIVFGNTKWNAKNRPCKITVEWTEPKRKGK